VIEIPAVQVSRAFAQQLSAGLGLPVDRNKPEPADLTASPIVVILLDGDEPKPEIEEELGATLHVRTVAIEAYVAGDDPSDDMHELDAKIQAAAVKDRTLGGLLFGHLREEYQFPFFDGMGIGALALFEAFMEWGTSHGGKLIREFHLCYATKPDDPLTLLTLAEIEG
jgi:hypothetical protein